MKVFRWASLTPRYEPGAHSVPWAGRAEGEDAADWPWVGLKDLHCRIIARIWDEWVLPPRAVRWSRDRLPTCHNTRLDVCLVSVRSTYSVLPCLLSVCQSSGLGHGDFLPLNESNNELRRTEENQNPSKPTKQKNRASLWWTDITCLGAFQHTNFFPWLSFSVEPYYPEMRQNRPTPSRSIAMIVVQNARHGRKP